MKKIRITTPENIEVEYTLADLGSRTAAAIIDMLIQLLFFILIFGAILLIIKFSHRFWEQYYGWIIGISLLAYMAISYGYFIVLELTMNGRTVGKKLLKLRAIRSNGQSVTLKHSAIRNLFRVFIDCYGFGMLFIFFSGTRKRIGDYAASTIVIAEESKVRPVSLESLLKINEHFDYYITDEESELLRDYFERRKSMEDCSVLREALKLHFTRKFQAAGPIEEWEGFIEAL